jgi:hypothetical protein
MERGLMWLPLLAIFIWLAITGYNEYQKVESYRLWAKEFDRCKYDIYAVLGLKGKDITWGKPAKNSPIDLQTFSLDRVSDVRMIVDERTVDLDRLPDRGKSIAIQFNFKDDANSISIPFTEISLAGEWTQLLQEEIGARG